MAFIGNIGQLKVTPPQKKIKVATPDVSCQFSENALVKCEQGFRQEEKQKEVTESLTNQDIAAKQQKVYIFSGQISQRVINSGPPIELLQLYLQEFG